MAQTQVSDIDVHPYLGAHDQDSAGWIGEVLPVPSPHAIGAQAEGEREPDYPPSAQIARREARAGSGEER